MRRLRAAVAGLALAVGASGAVAQEAARALPDGAEVDVSRRGALEMVLPLDRAVPWRAFALSDPPRVVIDAAEVDWTALGQVETDAPIRTGRVAPGWTRLVVMLEAPVELSRAWMAGDPPAIRVEAVPGEGADGPLLSRAWDVPALPEQTAPRPRRTGERPLVVALDPGHGGIDPGARRGGVEEADLMLRFAGELAAVLRQAGHEVVLTRDADDFVSLRGRPAVARAREADLMISLHADALAEGDAEGASVYTLSDAPTADLAAELVARQGRGDVLLGVDLPEGGDEVAQVLVELARLETAPRSDALAAALVEAIGAAGIGLHKTPMLGGDFTVLKAPDIPTVLLELGFMSSEADLSNILSPDWRSRMAVAILRGVEAWATVDAADARKLRR